MKKWFCAFLALTLVLGTGCTPQQDEKQDAAPSGIYYDVTGIAPQETVMTVDGREIPAELFFYFAAYNCSSNEYQIQYYNMNYGMFGENMNEDGTLKWDSTFMDTKPLRDYIRELTDDNVKYFAAIENMAAANGVVLTEEDEAALAQSRADAVAELGSEEAFAEQMEIIGVSEEGFHRINAIGYLRNGLLDLVYQEGSPLYLPLEDFNNYATYADHILLATINLDTREPLSEEEIAAKRQTAEDLLAQLQASEDVETLFTQLADEYSEDTGRATNPDGYVYTPGTMVTEFEDAAAALSPGQISGIVETDYGYHILLRKDLIKGLETHPDMKETIAGQHLQSLLDTDMEKAQVEVGEALNEFDIGAFYDAYSAIVQARQEAKEEDGTDGATGNGEVGGATGNGEVGGATSNGEAGGAAGNGEADGTSGNGAE